MSIWICLNMNPNLFRYLFLYSFLHHWNDVVPLMPILQARATNAPLVGATVNVLQFIMTWTDYFLRLSRDFSELMGSPPVPFVVSFQVDFTVRCLTFHTERNSSVFLSHANVALVNRRVAATLLNSRSSQFLYDISQHGVSGESRSGAEGPSALRATVLFFQITFSPVTFNALHTVAVTARYSDRLPQHVQTHRTAELLFVHRYVCACHVLPQLWLKESGTTGGHLDRTDTIDCLCVKRAWALCR